MEADPDLRAPAACVACCGERASRLPIQEPLVPGEGAYTWWACEGCGSHFAWPRRAMDYQEAYETAAIYKPSLATLQANIARVEAGRDGEHYNRIIAHLLLAQARADQTRTLLDVGAGNGFMMALAQRLGFQVAGVDVSPQSRAFIEAHVPGARMVSALTEVVGPFTHISLLEVLEHVEDPEGFLRALRTKLADNGLLILSVPNVERMHWRVFQGRGGERAYWVINGIGDTAPQHLTRFSRRGLLAVLSRAGFSSVHAGFAPLDAIGFGPSGVGSEPQAAWRIAGVKVPIPFEFLRGYLTAEIANKISNIDESLGFSLMAVASPAPGLSAALEASFRQARDEALRKHLAQVNRDLFAIAWEERRHITAGAKKLMQRVLSLGRSSS